MKNAHDSKDVPKVIERMRYKFPLLSQKGLLNIAVR